MKEYKIRIYKREVETNENNNIVINYNLKQVLSGFKTLNFALSYCAMLSGPVYELQVVETLDNGYKTAARVHGNGSVETF